MMPNASRGVSAKWSIGFALAFLCAHASAATPDPAHEGDWYVSDDTDNNTGKREVSATSIFIDRDSPDFVRLTLRCRSDQPVAFLEWDEQSFPDQTVVTIGPVLTEGSEPIEKPYIFSRSNDPVYRGLLATPTVSQNIVTALTQAKYATISIHQVSGTRLVGLRVDGTAKAWARVVSHCPAQKTVASTALIDTNNRRFGQRRR